MRGSAAEPRFLFERSAGDFYVSDKKERDTLWGVPPFLQRGGKLPFRRGCGELAGLRPDRAI
jgi:hypothetical protein